MSQRLCFLFVFLLLPSFPVSGFADEASPASADEVLLIVSTPFEGEMRDFGLPTLQAVELAVEDYNAAGGVLGKPVRFLPFNDECQPGKAGELMKLVGGSNATLMVGPICNGMAREVLPMLGRQGVVVISPSVTDSGLTKTRSFPLFFRTMWPADAQPEKQVAFLKKKGFTRLALLHDASEQGVAFEAVVRRMIEGDPDLTMVYQGDLVGGEEAVPAVKAILGGKAEAVIYEGGRGLGCVMLALLREAGFAGAFISGDQFWDDALLGKMGDFSEELYFTGPMEVGGNPLYQVALERFRSRIQGADLPGPYFYYAYSATLALLNAVNQAGNTDAAAVAEMLRSRTVDTPLGPISFDEAGDVVGAGMVVYQYKNGEIREVSR